MKSFSEMISEAEEFTMQYGDPAWIDTNSGEIIPTDKPSVYPNHIFNILENPRRFGITVDEAHKGRREPRAAWAARLFEKARANGFVMKRFNNFIGHSMEHVRQAIEHYEAKRPGELRKTGIQATTQLYSTKDGDVHYEGRHILPQHFQRFLSLGEIHENSPATYDKWNFAEDFVI